MTSFVVVGDGEPAQAVLEALSGKATAIIVALFTSSARSSPLVNFAQKQNIPVRSPGLLADPEAALAPTREGVDWLLSANNTAILPGRLLALCRCGALNLHPGLLPEYAGLHTHQWAIRNAEKEFGATIHFMEPTVDAGAIVRQRRFPLLSSDTGITVFRRCLRAGVQIFAEVISDILSERSLVSVPQDLTKRLLYRHRDNLDGRIEWNWSAPAIEAFVRAGNYEPFRSPSYVACLDPTMDFTIEVLRVEIDGPGGKIPGSILEVTEKGLTVASGRGGSIRITRARGKEGLLDAEKWRSYMAQLPNSILQGRSGPAFQMPGPRLG
jgi:methionyl-tRNA formyltransferase